MFRWFLAYALLLLCSFSHTFGQDTLTFAQVYDYAVGDVFQVKGETGENLTYETYTVLDKYLSAGEDTLRYQLLVDYANYTDEPPYTQFSRDTQELRIIAPNRPAVHGNRTLCVPTRDTTFFSDDFCGKKVWVEEPTSVPPNCNDLVEHRSYLVEGLGGPYYTSEAVTRDNWAYPYFQYELMYYKKGEEVCGDFFNSAIQLSQTEVSIFPNPSNGAFQVNSSIPAYNSVQLFDIQGRMQEIQLEEKGQGLIHIRTKFKGLGLLRIQTQQGVWWGRVMLR